MPASLAVPIPLPDIRDAARRLEPHLHRTPVLSSRSLGERAGVTLYLKAENLQKTGSFKPRGALNLVLTLPESKRARGPITVSAGDPPPDGARGGLGARAPPPA